MANFYNTKMNTGIISIVYLEPEWQATKKSIVECNVPTVYVDRGGIGSLAEACNRGFREIVNLHNLRYVWFITNPIFSSAIFPILIDSMNQTGYDAIHPAFNSDHPKCQPDGSKEIKLVDFVEFTAPMVKVDTFNKFQLDEDMPYWGHDFDWGWRVNQNGGKIAVHHGIQVKHTYIRFNKDNKRNPFTKKRHELRHKTNASTARKLHSLYGDDWYKKPGYQWAQPVQF